MDNIIIIACSFAMFCHSDFFHFFFCQQCFQEIEEPYDESVGRDKKMSRDDWAHGSLLIINELLRCSNLEVEVRYKSY